MWYSLRIFPWRLERLEKFVHNNNGSFGAHELESPKVHSDDNTISCSCFRCGFSASVALRWNPLQRVILHAGIAAYRVRTSFPRSDPSSAYPAPSEFRVCPRQTFQ